MRHRTIQLYLALALISCTPCLWAQPAPRVTVPRLVQFSGTLSDRAGTPLAGVTFALYKDQEGGAAIWQETQNVTLDAGGRYTAILGSTTNSGLPAEVFDSGQARWLGVQPEGQPEQPRVLLLSVPYALKAADAETIGGLPPSAFLLAPLAASGGATAASAALATPALETPALAGSGTLDFVPLWTPDGNTLGNSIIFQNSSSNIGIGTQTPGAKLDVAGSGKVRGTLLLPATGSSTATAGKNSQPLNLAASAFSSSVSTAVNETFSLRAEPAGNDTSTPSATLNLLFGSGTSTPTETGLLISSTGVVTFATGQTFPGTGTITGVTAGSGLTGGGTSGNVSVGLFTSCATNQVLEWNGSAWVCAGVGTGTITGVTAGTDLTGGGTTGNVTLNLDTSKVPQLSTNNTFSGNQTINGSVQINGGFGGQSGTFSANAGGGNVLVGSNTNTSTGFGVFGQSMGFDGVGVQGTGGIGVIGTSSSAQGPGVVGSSNLTGVQGEVNTTTTGATGVFGEAENSSGATFGVTGLSASPNGTGVLGEGVGRSVTGGGILSCCPVGVWGDIASNLPGAAALVGTADDARGILAQNNSPSGVPTAFMFQGASGKLALLAGGSVGACSVDTNGNLACHGSKSAVVPVDRGARQVALYAVEAPQNWFEDLGSGELANGVATIALEPTFAQTVNTTNYHVFLTPRGDCEGLYVADATETGFEVRELRSGKSHVAFDYRIVALRRGYENVRLADKTEMMAKLKEGTPKAAPGAPLKRPSFTKGVTPVPAVPPRTPAGFATQHQ